LTLASYQFEILNLKSSILNSSVRYTLFVVSASDLLKTASAAATDVVTNTESGRAFRKVVRDFVDALARVPGLPATEFSPLELEQLSSKAEHVIAAIERHIEDDDDKESARLLLGDEIDEVRRQITEINRWRRHYLSSPTSS
jgi:hypothetical protein